MQASGVKGDVTLPIDLAALDTFLLAYGLQACRTQPQLLRGKHCACILAPGGSQFWARHNLRVEIC